jgi:outer membrane protein
MNHKLRGGTLAMALCLASMAAQAQNNVFKFGLIRYTTDSKTNGIQGIGVPAGADAKTGNADTLLLVVEHLFTPNIGVELVFGVPPKIKAKATGTVAFLGDDILSSKIIAPTLLANYHFGEPDAALRPYVGAGINYTKFVDVKSKLAPDVKIGDSTGLVVQAGLDYAIDRQWGLFASVAKLNTKSKLVAVGATVLTTTIDFRPVTYQIGASFRF